MAAEDAERTAGGARRWAARLAPVLVPAALGAWQAAAGHRGRALVLVAVAAVIAALGAVGVPVERLAGRVGRVVGTACSAVLVAVFGVGVVMVGAAARLARLDVLGGGSRRRPEPRWRPAAAAGPGVGTRFATRTFGATPDSPARRSRVATVVRAAVLATGVVAIVVGGAKLGHRALTAWRGPSGPTNIVFPAWAFPHEPWVADLHAAGWPTQFHPSLQWKSADVTSAGINVKDGVRRSWEPPTHRLVVWFVGGSTMYGLGQRDDHTIASELSRLAAPDGTPIEAVNLGVPGYDQWQENQLVIDRLGRGERPDLIVYYDGANDLTAMEQRGARGITPLDEPPNRFQDPIETETNYRPEDRTGHTATTDQIASAYRRVYGAGVDLARRIGRSYGIPVEVYWQPQFASTRPSTHDGELTRAFPELAPGAVDGERSLVGQIRRTLPAGVVDVAGAVDGATVPVFFDPVHTNETGARMVAAAMWPTLRTALATALAGRPAGG